MTGGILKGVLPTTALEVVLNESNHPNADLAIHELNQLRAVQAHLVTHYVAVRRQNETLHKALQDSLLFGKL